MNKFVSSLIVLSLMSSPAYAWDTYTPPPPPPMKDPGNVQSQTQSQHQTATGIGVGVGIGGAGGAGGKGGAGGTGVGGNGGSSNASSNATGGAGGSSNANSSANSNQSLNNQGAGSNSNNYNQAGIPASTATAPSFAIGQCMFAISGGFQIFGAGVSGGTAGMYEFCKAVYKAQYFRQLGREDMAKTLECNYDEFRSAYKASGTPCRADVPKEQLATTPIVQPAPTASPANPQASAGYMGPNGFVPFPAGGLKYYTKSNNDGT